MEQQQSIQTCRFYRNQFPKVDDLVVVEIVKIEESSLYVELLEYNRISGMIIPSELTKFMKDQIHKALRQGNIEIAKVLKVDEKNGYIDLSKKINNQQEQTTILQDRYAKAKKCKDIIVSICMKKNVTIERMYQNIIWPLTDIYKHPFEAFTQSLDNPSIIDKLKVSDDEVLDKEVKTLLHEHIKMKIQPKSVKVACTFNLTCNSFEGVNAIKSVLKVGEACSLEKFPIQFHIVGSPEYAASITTQDRQQATIVLQNSMDTIKAEIAKYGGYFSIKNNIKVYGVNKKGELEFHKQEEALEEDDEESDESGMGAADSDYEK